MKVLFAVNNESISEAIIKKYQQEYKEIISSKNVYYIDATTRELQKDKTYDRIVISEDVEPFANNNYGVIDKFIFERLDNISDEATTRDGQDIPIILICADRREKSESILVKLFGIGIYSALLGKDRTIANVCELMNKPRNKKDAKIYYRIESEDVDYKAEGEGDVNEVEIQNILTHYKRLGKNEEEYVRSFNNIAEQYTDAQLRVICKFLPLNVKAVLEAESQKYQELITFGTVTPSISQGRKTKNEYVPNQEYQNKKIKNTSSSGQLFEKSIGKSELTKPVVIPKVAGVKKTVLEENNNSVVEEVPKTVQHVETMPKQEKIQNELDQNDIEDILQSVETEITQQEEPVKKKRGRPRKIPVEVKEENVNEPKRGRPKKVQPLQESNYQTEVEEQEDVDLFNLGMNNSKKESEELILPGLEETTNNTQPNIQQNEETVDLFSLGSKTQSENINYNISNNYNTDSRQLDVYNQYEPRDNSGIKNLLSMSNKLIAFVGTSKNGTSFLVNSTAEMLSRKGIKTAILDLTQNKNSYYIYTQNDEGLRNIAFSCINNLQNGTAKGIEVNKNLTVFTTLPEGNDSFNNYQSILTTLMKNYSLVIMDCDYNTNYSYFDCAQEIYLVQSFDILTIQPLTAFLRNLKSKNILDQNKIRIVLNKSLRIRSVTDNMIIGGMSSYNDPAMSYMTELFDKDNVKYCSIPFDQEAYSRYLEGLVTCEISVKGYPKSILDSLENLCNMIYPLLNNDRPANKFNTYNQYTNGFSSNMNATLNKMKNRY